jgi:MoxR-like ATPase
MSVDVGRDLANEQQRFDELLTTAKAEIGKAVIGHEPAVEAMMIAVLSRGHILLEGPPGSAKTLLARALARSIGGHFRRVQMTPEAMTADIVGEVSRRGPDEVFNKGPIFTNVFLADEINRGPARTQAALLEAMQERHVTMSGRTYWIDPPFTTVATQNPYEHQGVYPLAESQLDRFLVKIEVGYPDGDQELNVLELTHRGPATEVIGDITPFLANGMLVRAQEFVDETEVPTELAQRIVDIVRYTRSARGVEMGASTRAAVHLFAAAKAQAVLRGDTSVIADDVKATAYLVLPHRIVADDPYRVVREAVVASFQDSAAADLGPAIAPGD